jgi:hypothetical protein
VAALFDAAFTATLTCWGVYPGQPIMACRGRTPAEKKGQRRSAATSSAAI